MKLPKKLKVAGHIYKVIYPYKFKERTDIIGQHDSYSLEIRLQSIDGGGQVVSDSRLKEVFWHEILHAVDMAFNSDSLEEDTIRRLGSGLYQVLNDNFVVKNKED